MNNNKVEGSNRNKTMKKQKLKEKITPIDDDGAKVHCKFIPSATLYYNPLSPYVHTYMSLLSSTIP